MIHSGEEKTNGIRCRFNPLIGINFQGAKISSDTGILLLREIDERFGITSALEGILQEFVCQGNSVRGMSTQLMAHWRCSPRSWRDTGSTSSNSGSVGTQPLPSQNSMPIARQRG